MKIVQPSLALAAILTTASVLSAQSRPGFYDEAAVNIARLIGMSPEGTKLWASERMAASDPATFKRSTELHKALGEQLALDRPDRALLKRLSAAIVAEEARQQRLENDQLLRAAFLLSDADRKALGRFMVRSASDELREPKPVLQALP
jgi:hypothetical protein